MHSVKFELIIFIIIVFYPNLESNIGNPYFIPKWSAFLKMPGPSHQPCGINLVSNQMQG